MHIPDGFLSTPVWAALNAISLPGIGFAARRIQSAATHSKAPLTGVLGAFVFAAQMINIPIAPGTSAHLLGGALLAATLGPAPASIVMTAVLAIQALLFQDGGLLALGANVFNLAIAGVLCGWVPWAMFGERSPKVAGFLGGALSVIVSGALAVMELVASGVPFPQSVLVLSVGLFAAGAVLEGAITAAVIGALHRMNPLWIQHPQSRSKVLRVLVLVSVALAAAGFVLASAWPDSLEMVAEHLGISDREMVQAQAPMADYRIGGIESESLARAAAGITGLALVFAVCAGASRLLRRDV